jgi:hypothetical protein
MHTTMVELLGGYEQRLAVELPRRFKARVHVWRLVLVAMLGFAGLGFTGGAASAESAVAFANSPAAGSPGSSITVSSSTPCLLPFGVQGPPIVRVVLAQGAVDARGIGSIELPVNASGTWSGTLSVGASASQGDAILDASCFSSAQPGGTTLAYQPRTFAVTALVTPVSARPVATAPKMTG